MKQPTDSLVWQLATELPNGLYVITTGPHGHWTDYETQVWKSKDIAEDRYSKRCDTSVQAFEQHIAAMRAWL